MRYDTRAFSALFPACYFFFCFAFVRSKKLCLLEPHRTGYLHFGHGHLYSDMLRSFCSVLSCVHIFIYSCIRVFVLYTRTRRHVAWERLQKWQHSKFVFIYSFPSYTGGNIKKAFDTAPAGMYLRSFFSRCLIDSLMG